jgi:hypothetical protein
MQICDGACGGGSAAQLTVDHLIPTRRGGDNLVWACRGCNCCKGAKDALEWMAGRDQFPPLLLLRRYLKLAVEICREKELMELPIGEAPALPFALAAIPKYYPPPSALRMWITDLD